MRKNNNYIGILMSLAATIWLIFAMSACKNTGYVKIFSAADTIQNCSVPYIVKFGADFETGSGDFDIKWDFGDGETSNEVQPVHIYREAGIYKVSVMVSQREASESRSIAIDLSASSKPVEALYEYDVLNDNLHAPANLLFFNLSKHATSYKWFVNNVVVSTKREPEYIFDERGNYIVKLESVCNGDTAWYARQIDIDYPPTDLLIRTVTISLPGGYIGKDLQCAVKYDIFNEESSVWVRGVRTFPVTWEWNPPLELMFFNGSFQHEEVVFLIYELGNPTPVYSFGFDINDWQADFYPRELTWQGPQGFSALVRLDYR